ncbi:MAG: glycosyltransferase family 4 protein, partial [Pseudonocardiaceae bacterium]
MNIGLIVHDLHEFGGHSLYTRKLADGLAERHDVTVYANRCERPPTAKWGVRQIRAWRQTALGTVKTFPFGLMPFAKELSGCDIVHAQGYCGGKPNVVTAHICMASYVASLRDISRMQAASLRAMLRAERKFYRQFDGRIIAISELVADGLRAEYGAQNRIDVIPHGVDSARFKPKNKATIGRAVRDELSLAEQQKVALYVGDLTKAHSFLKEFARRAPHVILLIVSRSQRYHWSAENVIFVPPANDIEKYYAAADMFLFPSTYDAFGMVALEAMAAGLPVFCSDRAGAAELITHGADGFVFPLDSWVGQTCAVI